MRSAYLLLALLSIQSVVGLSEGNAQRRLTILQTTDSSDLAIAAHVQGALASLFQQSQIFQVQVSELTLSAYTPEVLTSTFSQTGSEILSFAYIDKDRVALFLFDVNRPGKYVATSETLSGSPTNRLTEGWIDNQISKAHAELMRQFAIANFELIPTSEENKGEAPAELTRQQRNRILFQELSGLQDGTYYAGVNIGMARFAAQGASASTVDVGAYLGVKVLDRWRLEAGVDLFSYLLINAGARFRLPIAERYVSLALGAGGALVAASFSQNQGFNPTYITAGQFLVGPSLSFDVPLLGASLRGDIKILLGSASVVLGTYGLYYAL